MNPLNKVDQRVVDQGRRNKLSREICAQEVIETIVEGKLEKLARAHYWGFLRGQAFYALRYNALQG